MTTTITFPIVDNNIQFSLTPPSLSFEVAKQAINFALTGSVTINTGGGGGGATAFTDLTDVPSAYTGDGGKLVAVKATVDGLEFIDKTSVGVTNHNDLSNIQGGAANDYQHLTTAQLSSVGTALQAVTPHEVLSTIHTNTVAASPVRGDLIVGNSDATPKWTRFAKGSASQFLKMKSDASDPEWAAHGLTASDVNAEPAGTCLRLDGSTVMTGYFRAKSETGAGTPTTAGQMRYNSTDHIPEFYDGSAWQSADCPVYLEGTGTGVSGNATITGLSSKFLIKWILVTAGSADMNWDLTLYSDSGFSTKPFQVVNDRTGNYAIYLDYPYINDSSTTSLYMTFLKNSGTGTTWNVRVLAMKMR